MRQPLDLEKIQSEPGTVDETRFDPLVKLDPSLEPTVTDAERLRTVLVNVLANAREAVLGRRSAERAEEDLRDSQGAPDVELRTQRGPSGRVQVAVIDRGGGIDPALLAHVFEPYFTTKRTGTGLGLAIAKNIVDALGGTLSASNVAGGGTEVCLDLPYELATERGTAASTAARSLDAGAGS